jgi:hypothetical protein
MNSATEQVVRSVRESSMDRPSQLKSHPAGSLSSSQPGGTLCWVISLAVGPSLAGGLPHPCLTNSVIEFESRLFSVNTKIHTQSTPPPSPPPPPPPMSPYIFLFTSSPSLLLPLTFTSIFYLLLPCLLSYTGSPSSLSSLFLHPFHHCSLSFLPSSPNFPSFSPLFPSLTTIEI